MKTPQKTLRWFYLPTIIASGFLAAAIGTRKCKKDLDKVRHSVEPQVYERVINERKNVYKTAVVKSIVLAIAYLLYTLNCEHSTTYHLTADTISIIMTFTYLFYMISTKKETLLTPENTEEWQASYKCMEINYWTYFVAGVSLSAFVLYMHDLWLH